MSRYLICIMLFAGSLFAMDDSKLPELTVKTDGKDILVISKEAEVKTEEKKSESPFSMKEYIAIENYVNNTALSHAVLNDISDAVSYLVERGADVNQKVTTGRTVLSYAKSAAMVIQLLKLGAQLEWLDDNEATPLHINCSSGTCASIKELVRQGACVNVRDKWKQTPLHHAATNRANPGAVKALLEAIDEKYSVQK